MNLKFINLTLVLCMCLFTNSGKTQTVNGVTFLNDFNTIVEDAKNGFPNTMGSLLKKEDWYGNDYTASKSIFGKSTKAFVYYIKAHEPTKYVPEATPELFYFSQYFSNNNWGYEFIKDSLQLFLDARAEELGLQKKEIK